MKYIISLISVSFIFSMTFHDDLISMTFNDNLLESPFIGGFNRPKIQWLDWDLDGDNINDNPWNFSEITKRLK